MDTLTRMKTMPVTLLLIAVNVIVYLLTVLMGMDIWQGNGEKLLHWGANYWPMTMQGQYWRLLTSMFLHAGLWHLFTNMLGLLIAGMFLEPVIRSFRFAAAYILTGIIADFVSIWYHRTTVGVGASGAVFGIYGVFLALLTTPLFRPSARYGFLIYVSMFVILNFIVALFAEGIDNAAHLAGFCSGFITGYLYFFTLSKQDGDRLPQ
ncbi:rhomboid family intramembrane serine protease [Chitinophaga solisilvae]|uniref:rhomboid family intramembrane serine protease n=1 Tax=Chitinophaga solisilvae TaxID=1233460 RepID=UPI001370FC58|nr:rhomboid family intramembrane serine protease [Chitinophaga solisilvae]